MDVIFLSSGSDEAASDFVHGGRDDLKSGVSSREKTLQQLQVLLQRLKAGHLAMEFQKGLSGGGPDVGRADLDGTDEAGSERREMSQNGNTKV